MAKVQRSSHFFAFSSGLFVFVFNKSKGTSCRPNYDNNNDDGHKSSTWNTIIQRGWAAEHKSI